MRRIRTVVLGIGFLVLLLAGAGAANLWRVGANDAGTESITIPIGHLGDVAHYRHSFDGYDVVSTRNGSSAWDPPPETSDGSFQVAGIVRAPDQTARFHDAVRFQTAGRYATRWQADPERFVNQTIGGNPGDCAVSTTDFTEFIGVDTRDPVSLAFQAINGCRIDPLVNPAHEARRAHVIYGPDFGGSGMALGSQHWVGSVLQGRTLHAGDEIEDIDARARSAMGEGWMERTFVVGPGTFEGREVWELRMESGGTYEEPAFGIAGWYWSNDTYLFRADSPWPVYYKENVSSYYREPGWAELWQHDDVSVLVGLDVGTQAIPWGPASLGERPPPRQHEWSPTSRPASGSAFPSAHRVEAAAGSVETDPTLVRFAIWRAQNPGATLVGARFAPTVGTAAGSAWANPLGATTWTVVYSSADGPTAFRVNSTRYADGHVVNSEGDWSLMPLRPEHRFQPTYLPSAVVTFADAAKVWSDAMVPFSTGKNPNYFVWGYAVIGDPYFSREVWEPAFWPRSDLRQVTAGFIEAQAMENPRARITSADVSFVVLNASTGDIARGLAVGWESPLQRAMGGASAPAQSAAPDNPRAEFVAPIVASGSILAVLLAAYFYPLLKYGTTTLLGAFPGYAKLHKSKLLDHASRNQILQLIREEPGISPPELHARVGGGWSTVVYHLGVLERNKLASSLIDGRHKRFFPVESMDWSRRAPLAALRNENTRRLYQLIHDQPGAHQAVLVRNLRIHHTSAQWHLDRLTKVGLVSAERRGRRVHYYAVPTTQPGSASATEIT